MNKILITGGAGFIGTNLCKKLLENKENYVLCLDNLYTGNIENIKVFQIIYADRFEFIEGDITNFQFLCNLFKNNSDIKEIYNCACPASPIHYQNKHSLKTLDTNYIGVSNLLKFVRKLNCKFMQFSTSEVYGDPNEQNLIQNETYRGNVNTYGPRACYDEGKRVAETLCYIYQKLYNCKIKIIRIFNTYGPYMNKNDGRVISEFIVNMLNNKNIPVNGNGLQTRSFCYIDDLIEGITKYMDSDIYGEIINLGNPEEHTILELANILQKLIKCSSKIIFKELPLDDPIHRRPDIDKAKKLLNWKPKISLIKGLEKTIEYFSKIN